MPEVVSCPDCQSKLRVPDNLLGKKVKCPKCSNAFTAVAERPAAPPAAARPRKPAPPPPEEEEEEAPRPRKPARRQEEEFEEEPVARKRKPAPPPPEDEEEEEEAPRARRRRRDEDEEEAEAPRRRRRRDDDDEDEDEDEDYEVGSIRKPGKGTPAEWRKVRSGFSFLIFGQITLMAVLLIALVMCGISMLTLTSGVRAGAQGGDPRAGMMGGIVLLLLTILVYGLGGLTSLGLTVTGHVFTLAAPPKHGAKTLAMVALILLGVSLAPSWAGCSAAWAAAPPPRWSTAG
jgi:predicted Zn finger-like uncharacterized protein